MVCFVTLLCPQNEGAQYGDSSPAASIAVLGTSMIQHRQSSFGGKLVVFTDSSCADEKTGDMTCVGLLVQAVKHACAHSDDTNEFVGGESFQHSVFEDESVGKVTPPDFAAVPKFISKVDNHKFCFQLHKGDQTLRGSKDFADSNPNNTKGAENLVAENLSPEKSSFEISTQLRMISSTQSMEGKTKVDKHRTQLLYIRGALTLLGLCSLAVVYKLSRNRRKKTLFGIHRPLC